MKRAVLAALLGLILCELVLRGAGFFYRKYRGDAPAADTGKMFTILCVGDSFTYGVGVSKGADYPSRLQALIDERYGSRVVRVINAGIPGENSSSLLKRMDAEMRRYRPDVVLVMTGMNNLRSFKDSNAYLFTDDKLKIAAARCGEFMENSRVYKLVKNLAGTLAFIARRNAARKGRAGGGIKGAAGPVNDTANQLEARGWAYYEAFDMDMAKECFQKARELEPHNSHRYYCLAIEAMHGRGDYKTAAELLEQGLNYCGDYCDQLYFELWLAYHLLGDAGPADRNLKNYMALSQDEGLKRTASFGLPSSKDIALFAELLFYDVGRIVSVVHKHGATAVIADYPHHDDSIFFYPLLSERLKAYADSHGVVFADNAARLNEIALKRQGSRGKYLHELGHCTAEGYLLIARNIYSHINGLLP